MSTGEGVGYISITHSLHMEYSSSHSHRQACSDSVMLRAISLIMHLHVQHQQTNSVLVSHNTTSSNLIPRPPHSFPLLTVQKQLNHELARESLLCMSSHAKRLPEANLATVHSLSLAACLAGVTRDRLICTICTTCNSETKLLCVLPTHST